MDEWQILASLMSMYHPVAGQGETAEMIVQSVRRTLRRKALKQEILQFPVNGIEPYGGGEHHNEI